MKRAQPQPGENPILAKPKHRSIKAGQAGSIVQRIERLAGLARINRKTLRHGVDQQAFPIIRIAAALIDDDQGRLLLVRKAGSRWFMQPGGKIEGDESLITALRRELSEEIGLPLSRGDPRYLGRFSAPAAHEAGHIVEAEIFHIRTNHRPTAGLEIEQAVWVTPEEAVTMDLAPLTRDHMLPLATTL